MNSRMLEIIEDRDKKLSEKRKQIDILYNVINDTNRMISQINEEIDNVTTHYQSMRRRERRMTSSVVLYSH